MLALLVWVRQTEAMQCVDSVCWGGSWLVDDQ
jgi:hypothetical protein